VSELNLVLKSIEAAKAANLAAIRALEAVEQMLGGSAPEPEPETEPEQQPEGCQHTDAVKVPTVNGSFLVCPCGHQQEI